MLTALDAVSAMSSNEYRLLRNLPVLLLRPEEYCLGDFAENPGEKSKNQASAKPALAKEESQGCFVESCVASAMARQQG
ncbi:hypothetical protein [Kiloniella laminariae]|uniref:hypothetical protein n=1 Tax=Kiloniella laminariae TaxID=454162 RepID=UPI0022B0FA94|nr:hypothetical protein [Kiloniella laminariae]